MKEKFIRGAFRAALLAKKHGPTVAVIGGAVAVAAGAVMLVRAAYKTADAVEAFKEDLEELEGVAEEMGESYTPAKKAHDLGVVVGKHLPTVVKPFLVPSSLVLGGVAALTGSHWVMRSRVLAISAVAAATQEAYDSYRESVRELLGDEKESRLFHGSKPKKLKADGETVEVEEIKNAQTWLKSSMYARVFDETSPAWDSDPDQRVLFLKRTQCWANDMLNIRGHLFLNEVYDRLGISRSPAGQVVGWVKGNGDDFVDFGLFDRMDQNKILFLNGAESGIILDFNVDGEVYRLI